ncbi:MAG TPA: hypothetical protein VMM60_15465 [Ilumatobacter sp.]|nr:hypothetical protein [Ilumatobacter sp.]
MSDEQFESPEEPTEVLPPGSAQAFIDAASMSGLIEDFVRQGLAALNGIAAIASAITKTIAVVGAVVVGVAMLIGVAALSGTAQTVLLVAGVVLLFAAVVAPLVATMRLNAIPKQASGLVSDLKVLAARLIDTHKNTGDLFAGAGRPTEGGVFSQVGAYRQQYSSITSLPSMFKDLTSLAPTISKITSLPTLFGIGFGAIALAGLSIPVLALVWLF